MFVYPTYRQPLNEVITGSEAAWAFIDRAFAVVIPDNVDAIGDNANATDLRLNGAFRE